MRVELLTDELKDLVGPGAKPHLILAKPQLLPLLVSSEWIDRLTLVQLGRVAQRELGRLVLAYDGSETFMGRSYSREQLTSAYLQLLGLSHSERYAPERRARVLMSLGIGCTVDVWRRRTGPERDFMSLLADYIHRAKTLPTDQLQTSTLSDSA